MKRNKKTINITKNQLQEVTVTGDIRPGENMETAAKRTVQDATSELGPNKVDSVSFSSNDILKCNKTYTKKEITEARKKFLEENSIVYNKKELFNLLKK